MKQRSYSWWLVALGPIDDPAWRRRILYIALGSVITPLLALAVILGSDESHASRLGILFALGFVYVAQFSFAMAYGHVTSPRLKSYRAELRQHATRPARPLWTTILLALTSLLGSVVVWGFIDPTAIWWILATGLLVFVGTTLIVDRRGRP